MTSYLLCNNYELLIYVCFLLENISDYMADNNPDTEEGKGNIIEMWVWGSDGYGRLGQGTVNKEKMKPHKVKKLENKVITSLACGAAHTMITCYDKTVGPGKVECYSWGKCHFGQLGHNELEIDQSFPRQLSEVLGGIEGKVVSVGCGQSFSFLITEKSTYSWGCGYYGALGHGNEESLMIPKLIEELELKKVRIKSIRGGAFHSVALSVDGEVFSWGRDHMGQLGLAPLSGTSKVRLDHKKPEKVVLPTKATKISTFCNHTMMLLDTGVLLSFGDNTHGQLGHEMPSYNANKDLKKGKEECRVRIMSEKGTYLPVLDMACGTHHSLAVTRDNKLYSWGRNSLRALGRKGEENTPIEVELHVKFESVSAGHEFSLALGRIGEDKKPKKQVYSWGENYLSKLGRETRDIQNEVPGKVNISILPSQSIGGIICAENHCTVWVCD